MSNNQDQINSKDFLIGTLIGGIVGASMALLWAPKSGRELRTSINEQAIIAKEKGGKLAESAKQKTTTLLDKVKNSGCCKTEEELFDDQLIAIEGPIAETASATEAEVTENDLSVEESIEQDARK
ncbi:MAG TPA: YtxH domain-containing protein [Bacillus bacterium]|nr:YtxH domain-containing protein [Bacillus sp. (in: firmicutes)]